MRIRFRSYGMLRQLLGEVPDTFEVPGPTLGHLVDYLAQRYGPQVRQELLDEAGNLDFAYAVFVRGERQNSLATPLQEGDEVVITNIIGGG